MNTLIAALFLFISSFAMAQSREDILKTMDQMKASGMFTDEQLEAAKERMKNMKDEEFNEMMKQANEKTQDPKIRQKAQEIVDKNADKLRLRPTSSK